jgi:hypothetical protein
MSSGKKCEKRAILTSILNAQLNKSTQQINDNIQ